MRFESPQLLLLLVLLIPLARWLDWRNRPVLSGVRTLLTVVALVAVARPVVDWVTSGVDILVVVDRSRSMTREARQTQQELLSLLSTSPARGPEDRVGLITFGRAAHLVSPPGQGGVSIGGTLLEDPDASDLRGALKLASRVAEPGRRTRLLVMSDGRYTGEDPVGPDVLADLHGVELWYRHTGGGGGDDVAAGSIRVPEEVTSGGRFLVEFSLLATRGCEVDHELRADGRVVSSGRLQVRRGVNRYYVRDQAIDPGLVAYTLSVSAEPDGVPENDSARALLRVTPAPRVLVVVRDGAKSRVADLLAETGLSVESRTSSTVSWESAAVGAYQAVVLEDLPLDVVGRDRVVALASTVDSGVTGLLVVGGPHSLGAGGYHLSPLDPLLPVSMELKEELRRGVMALVVVLDRSGSMGVQVVGGRTKMALADAAVVEAIRLLSPLDQLAVIAVDSEPKTILPLSVADDTRKLQALIMQIAPGGGGIYVRTALQAAAVEIRGSALPTRHILLFADAGDAEEQEDSVDFAAHLAQEGIQVGVIALGRPSDPDAGFLKALARAGKGRIVFTDRPRDLPRVFSQEVLRMAQRGYRNEKTPTRVTPDAIRLLGHMPAGTPVLEGYNPSTLRQTASCAMVTTGADTAFPVVAFWQHGRTRAAVVTTRLDGLGGTGLLGWEPGPGLVASLVQKVLPPPGSRDAALFATVRRGTVEVTLEIDPEATARVRATPVVLRLLSPPGKDPIDVNLEWLRPDLGVARVTLPSPGDYLPVVDLGKAGVITGPPVSLAYSPEFLPDLDPGAGKNVLENLAQATGGSRLGTVDALFDDQGLEPRGGRRDFTPWLAAIALLLLVLEVAERRLAFLDSRLSAFRDSSRTV